MTINRADLRTRIRQAADMVGSAFIDDTTELNPMIDRSAEDLHDFLVSEFGDSRFARSMWFNVNPRLSAPIDSTIVWPVDSEVFALVEGASGSWSEISMYSYVVPGGGTASGFNLPYDFRRLVRVHFAVGAVTKVPITIDASPSPIATTSPNFKLVTSGNLDFRPMRAIDLYGEELSYRPRSWQEIDPTYRIVDGPHQEAIGEASDAEQRWVRCKRIQFLPVPTENYAVQLFYVPQARLLADDSTLFGYDYPEWIVYDCAAECLEKQGSDSSTQRARLDRVRERIRNNARNVDVANPKRITTRGMVHTQVGMTRQRFPWLR